MQPVDPVVISVWKTGAEPSEALIQAVFDINAVIRFAYRNPELYPRFHYGSGRFDVCSEAPIYIGWL